MGASVTADIIPSGRLTCRKQSHPVFVLNGKRPPRQREVNGGSK
jgi:hypothetical protein